MNKKKRNADIGEMFKQGHTQAVIGAKHKITTARVGQILREIGILQAKDPEMTNRNSFIGAHVDKEVKTAMKEAAEQDGKSLSRFVSNLVEEEVKRRRVPIEAE